MVDFADFEGAADVAADVLNLRQEANVIGVARALPLPKATTAAGSVPFRQMCVMDPADEIRLRVATDAIAENVERQCAALGPTVLGGRLVLSPSGWRTRTPRYGSKARRDLAMDYVESDDFAGLGKADIRSFYPSVSLTVLESTVARVSPRPGAAQAIIDVLTALAGSWNIPGLPLGPEASVVLANAVLLPVDRALRRLGYWHQRYVDDLQFMVAPEVWPDLQADLEELLSQLGLTVNDGKYALLERRHEARESLSDPLLTLLSDDSTPPNVKRELALSTLGEELDKDQPNMSRVNFIVPALRKLGEMGAITLIEERGFEILRLAPRKFGDYLAHAGERGALDIDWLVSLATVPPQADTAVAQLHLLKVGTGIRGKLSSESALRLLELSTGSGDPRYGAVRAWAAEAWGSSRGWKPSLAGEAAEGAAEPTVRRALTLTLRHGDGKKTRAACRRMASYSETRVSADWAARAAA